MLWSFRGFQKVSTGVRVCTLLSSQATSGVVFYLTMKMIGKMPVRVLHYSDYFVTTDSFLGYLYHEYIQVQGNGGFQTLE